MKPALNRRVFLKIYRLKTEHLTFTRFIAAIVIVFFHFGIDAPPFNNNFFHPLIANAGLSVSYFFILSGFVMIVAYGRKSNFSTVDYLRNRAARILPLYYTAMILMIVYYFIRVNMLHTPSDYHLNAGDTILNGLLIQSWVPDKALTLNRPAWSLSVETFFYIAFPFIFSRFFKRISLHVFILITVIFFVVSQTVFHMLIYNWPNDIYYFYFFPPLRLNEFLIGNALGALFLVQKEPLKYAAYGVIVLLVISVFALRMDSSPVDFHNGLFAIFFAPMLYLLASSQGLVNRLFRRKALVFLGEISYGVYIFQYPVYFFFTSALTFCGYKITAPLFYVYLLLLLIFSAVCHVLIEIPLRRRLRKFSPQTTTLQSHS